MRRLFYTTKVNHHHLDAWAPLAEALRRDVEAACGKNISVTVGDQPVFGYGGDFEETMAELEEMRLGREVRIDLWSSIVFYSAIGITLGSEIKRPERRALEKKLRKTLRGEKLLRTVEGAWDEESGRVYGYALSMADAEARASIEHLLFALDPPFYLGERWLLQDEKERLDETAFKYISEVAPGLVTFVGRSGEGFGEQEELVWQSCSSGDGLIACFPDDEALPSLIQRFHDMEDLRILLAEKPSAGMRVTIDRCHQDDSLVVAYTPPHAPEIETPILFMI